MSKLTPFSGYVNTFHVSASRQSKMIRTPQAVGSYMHEANLHVNRPKSDETE